MTRVLAKVIDVVIGGFLIWVGSLLVAEILHSSPEGLLIAEIVPLVLVVGYLTYRVGRTGQTWGMKTMSIRCVRASDGLYPIGLGVATIRWLVAVLACMVPLGIVVDSLWLLWDPRRQTIHDKLCKTVVVRTGY